jgi:hypothetical protein
MLQKVLQLYASKSLQKRSYAYKGSLFFLSCITGVRLVMLSQNYTSILVHEHLPFFQGGKL